MRSLLLLLLALPLCGQIGFSISPPQESRIPGVQEYLITVSNGADQVMPVYGISGYEHAESKGIQWLGNVSLQQHIDKLNGGWGFWRIAGIACEVGGATAGIAVAGDLAKIKERVIVIAPVAAGGCALGRALYNREHKTYEVPRDLLPPLFSVPPHSRVSYSIFGR